MNSIGAHRSSFTAGWGLHAAGASCQEEEKPESLRRGTMTKVKRNIYYCSEYIKEDMMSQKTLQTSRPGMNVIGPRLDSILQLRAISNPRDAKIAGQVENYATVDHE
jgi:sialic acid synthase SpsE